MAAANTNTMKLRSSDDQVFTVEVAVIATMSGTIRTWMEDLEVVENTDWLELPLNGVTGNILEKVIEWCERNYRREGAGDEGQGDHANELLAEWNKAFLEVDDENLYAITRAAIYLDIDYLWVLCKNQIRIKLTETLRSSLPLEFIQEIFRV